MIHSRHVFRRTLITAGLSATMALASAGLASSQPNTARARAATPVHVALFTVTTGSTFNEQFINAAKAVAAKMGPATVAVFNANFTTATQMSQLRDALVSKNYNVWIVNPNDGATAEPVMKQAIAQGIKVVCLYTPCGPSYIQTGPQFAGLVAVVGEGSFYTNGQTIGNATVQACAKFSQCNVFYMPGESAAPYDIARTAGFESVIKMHPNIKIVAKQDGAYAESQALTVTQNVLKANSNINVIATASDQQTLGAEKAVIVSGDKGKILLVGNGGGASGVDAVKAGRWYATTTSLPYTMATLATTLGIKAARGSSTNGKVVNDLAGHTLIITKANAGSVTPQWSGA
jgi:ribose transport system substrate-binding protein